ncbi:hypothetical protein DEU56DRAFT_733642 [Suillus clintonianus]|uniref:uncharacterized protein n=1 Tax=Suillus clintonianus TaxID=1904413 RepID=UPI001B879390|nr:uncharacterized protein DEU56DRAFT_733642 [Suillus clintonianus]KAG2142368.1 hypothetical protein DEU56DRAFT_733642 [Suillus clintonianus]
MRTFGIERDSRILEIIVSGKPFPLTKLNGDEFLSAWWQAVVCHYTLWKHDIHHRDVNPGNLRVHRSDGRWIGVLNDHDLSSTQRNRPTGNEHIKAVPFVAIDLLEVAAIEGNVSHLYQHDAESFVWVLVWVCLRYRDGKLLRVKEGRLLDEWLTVDAEECYDLKSGFIRMFRKEDDLDLKIRPSSSHKSTNWKLAVKCLHTLYYSSRASVPDDKSAFEKLLLVNMKCVAPRILHPVEVS